MLFLPEDIEKELKKIKKSACCSSYIKTNEQSGNEYTLIKSDSFKVIKTTSNSAVDVNIPTNSAVPYNLGTIIFIEQWGNGQVTFVPSVGVTLNSEGGADKIAAKYGSAYLRKDGTNTWILIGNISS